MKRLTFIFFFALWNVAGFGAKFYVDPMAGSMSNDGSFDAPWSTFAEVISQNKIESYHYLPLPYSSNSHLNVFNQGAPVQAGDTIYLRNGLHGDIVLAGYQNIKPIYVFAQAGQHPVFRQLDVAACRNWVFAGIDISSEPYGDYLTGKLVKIESHNWHGPCSLIELHGCRIFSGAHPWTTADEWLNKVSDGVFVRADSIRVLNNDIRNVAFGIQLVGDYNEASGNDIVNFSADGARIEGSHNVFDGNLIKNCYKVDDNHDDGIQSFTTGGVVVDDNVIRNNIILNYDNPNQALLGSMQGIGCFDGFYHDWVIENNLVVVNHWHGISMYGAINCRIINNTVLDPTPGIAPGPSWIKIANHKNGQPSTGCTVKNNVANSFDAPGQSVGSNQSFSTVADYHNNFVDADNYDFNLLSNSVLVDAGDAAVAPPFDINGTSRANGQGPDIGAYEYEYIVGTEEVLPENDIFLLPNPASDKVSLMGRVKGKIYVFSSTGLLVKEVESHGTVAQISLNNLESGTYFFAFRNETSGELMVRKLVVER